MKPNREIETILEQCGFPTDWVMLDFETYFDDEYSLKTMNYYEYIKDKRFEVLGCGVSSNMLDSDVFLIKDGISGSKKTLERSTLVFQNANFDGLILKEHYGINPRHTIDVKHLAAHQDSKMSHRLKDLAKKYELQAKGDTDDFKGLHFNDMDTEKLSKLSEYCLNDVDLQTKLFAILLTKLSNPTKELTIACHTTRLYLYPSLDFDVPMAEQLASDMESQIQEAVEKTGFEAKEISGSKSIIPLVESVLPEGEHCPMKQGKKGQIPALAKADFGMQLLLNHQVEAVRNLAEARLAVKSWPLHVKKVRNMMRLAEAADGKMPVPLNYYGGHTGRFSGGGGINLQNLGGAGRTGSGNHPLLPKARQLLMAPEGMKLIVVDAAQIEARVLAWYAGQEDLLEGYANGDDVYSEFAQVLFKAMVRKPKPDDPKPIADRLTLMRGFGKDAILGCGYGMGSATFHDNCLKNTSLKPMFDDGTFDGLFIEKLIKTYRTKYNMIPQFWKDVEGLFKLAIKYPHQVSEHGNLKAWMNSSTLVLQLPSTRCLFYPHAAIKQTSMGSEIRYRYGHLWGGAITENIVQATARDLLVEWILECEREGILVVLHVHDETVAVAPDETAEADLAKVEEIMSTNPAWSEGLPLAVEGQLLERYAK